VHRDPPRLANTLALDTQPHRGSSQPSVQEERSNLAQPPSIDQCTASRAASARSKVDRRSSSRGLRREGLIHVSIATVHPRPSPVSLTAHPSVQLPSALAVQHHPPTRVQQTCPAPPPPRLRRPPISVPSAPHRSHSLRTRTPLRTPTTWKVTAGHPGL
jgi:hypothetical protein